MSLLLNGDSLKIKRAVFLDRDGVINYSILRNGIPYAPRSFSEFKLIENSCNAILDLKELNYEIIVVTNQPDLSNNLVSFQEIQKFHDYIKNNVGTIHFYVCPHTDLDNCECRKPKPGLLLTAAKELQIDLKNSYLVGDRWRDIEAGQSVGCQTFFVDNFYSERKPLKPYVRVDSLREAADLIMKEKLEY